MKTQAIESGDQSGNSEAIESGKAKIDIRHPDILQEMMPYTVADMSGHIFPYVVYKEIFRKFHFFPSDF